MRRIGVVILHPRMTRRVSCARPRSVANSRKPAGRLAAIFKLISNGARADADWVRSTTERALSRTPDVLLANGDPADLAAHRLTTTVPVIFIGNSDPVEMASCKASLIPAATSPDLP